jgi:hypothetical protein
LYEGGGTDDVSYNPADWKIMIDWFDHNWWIDRLIMTTVIDWSRLIVRLIMSDLLNMTDGYN